MELRLKMGLKDFAEKWKHKGEVFNEMQVQDSAATKLQERKLSANERELNKILHQKREAQIKKQLERFHEQEKKEYWHKDVITQKYIFKEKPVTRQQPNVVKQKNLFKGKGRFK